MSALTARSPPCAGALEGDAEAVARLLASLLGPGFAVAASRPVVGDETPFPEEGARLARAGAGRRAEFATGRACARRALGVLGLSAQALPPSPGGAPLWPPGVVGSLSHTGQVCAAAVARARDAQAVGIDLEIDAPLEPDLLCLVCTPAERAWISGRDAASQGRLGKLVFSAKEAFYKCQHALTATFLDFKDVEITIDEPAQGFRVVRARGAASAGLDLASVRGRFGQAGGHLVTTAVAQA